MPWDGIFSYFVVSMAMDMTDSRAGENPVGVEGGVFLPFLKMGALSETLIRRLALSKSKIILLLIVIPANAGIQGR
jgi:hypothetical protein